MVVWLIGMSGAGKSAIGIEVYKGLKSTRDNVVFLDGDDFRTILGDDLGHTLEDRRRNADRFCRMCKFLDDNGIHVIASILSIFPESREWNRNNLKSYFQVFVDVSFDELVRRDSKGLYAKALKGEIKDVVGVDIKFTPPEKSDLVISNEDDVTIDESASLVLTKIPPLLD